MSSTTKLSSKSTYIGSRVSKYFGSEIYHGTVTSYDPNLIDYDTKEDLGPHYHIKYDDEDQEDVNSTNLLQMLHLYKEYKTKTKTKIKTKNKNNNKDTKDNKDNKRQKTRDKKKEDKKEENGHRQPDDHFTAGTDSVSSGDMEVRQISELSSNEPATSTFNF